MRQTEKERQIERERQTEKEREKEAGKEGESKSETKGMLVPAIEAKFHGSKTALKNHS